ncbi:hypothetical protein AK812_SmicGene25006 [Symbiodinium microadriaticum]|uniref:BRCT domain-containing protein n=1 Tax=Symbiodinium microadriaticum TaxID=2951 RepID=A0A1Q9DDB1_SYMMI|nr:hypothetical protein AK812_SmicGene25006 [Symbiodinium microadriaticum]
MVQDQGLSARSRNSNEDQDVSKESCTNVLECLQSKPRMTWRLRAAWLLGSLALAVCIYGPRVTPAPMLFTVFVAVALPGKRSLSCSRLGLTDAQPFLCRGHLARNLRWHLQRWRLYVKWTADRVDQDLHGVWRCVLPLSPRQALARAVRGESRSLLMYHTAASAGFLLPPEVVACSHLPEPGLRAHTVRLLKERWESEAKDPLASIPELSERSYKGTWRWGRTRASEMFARTVQPCRLRLPAARFAAAGSLFRIRGADSTSAVTRSPAAPFTRSPAGQVGRGSDSSHRFPGAASSEAAFNLASGQQTMKVGKYKGKTFTEIYAQDPQYCRWVCDIALTGEKTTDSLKIFAAFVQHRWLLAIRDLFRESRPNSLRSHRFVLLDVKAVTGQPDDMSRELLESFIRVLGGEVVSQVAPSSKPAATGVVVAGSTLYGGKPVQQSSKLEKAAAGGIPVLTLEDLRNLAIQAPEDFLVLDDTWSLQRASMQGSEESSSSDADSVENFDRSSKPLRQPAVARLPSHSSDSDSSAEVQRAIDEDVSESSSDSISQANSRARTAQSPPVSKASSPARTAQSPSSPHVEAEKPRDRDKETDGPAPTPPEQVLIDVPTVPTQSVDVTPGQTQREEIAGASDEPNESRPQVAGARDAVPDVAEELQRPTAEDVARRQREQRLQTRRLEAALWNSLCMEDKDKLQNMLQVIEDSKSQLRRSGAEEVDLQSILDSKEPLLPKPRKHSMRARVYDILEGKGPYGSTYSFLLTIVILVNIASFMLSTEPSMAEHQFDRIEMVTVCIFTFEYAIRCHLEEELQVADGKWLCRVHRLGCRAAVMNLDPEVSSVICAALYYWFEKDNADMIYCPDEDGKKEGLCWNRFHSIPAAMYYSLLNFFGEFPLADKHSLGGRFVGGFIQVMGAAVMAIPAGALGNAFSEVVEKELSAKEQDLAGGVDDESVAAQVVRCLDGEREAVRTYRVADVTVDMADLWFSLLAASFSWWTVHNLPVKLDELFFLLYAFDILSTLVFCVWCLRKREVEYFFRICSARAPARYLLSGFGVVDGLPTPQSVLFVTGGAAAVLWVIFSTLMYYAERYNPDPDMAGTLQQHSGAFGTVALSWSKVRWVTLLNLSGEAPLCEYTPVLPRRKLGHIVAGLIGVGFVTIPMGLLGSGFQDYLEQEDDDDPVAKPSGQLVHKFLQGSASNQVEDLNAWEARAVYFERCIFLAIFVTVLAAIMETVDGFAPSGSLNRDALNFIEITATLLFTIEYGLRYYTASLIGRVFRKHSKEFQLAAYAAAAIWLIFSALMWLTVDDLTMGQRYGSMPEAMSPYTLVHLTGDYPLIDYDFPAKCVLFVALLFAVVAVPTGLLASGFAQELTKYREEQRRLREEAATKIEKDNPYKLRMVKFLEQKTTAGRLCKKAMFLLIILNVLAVIAESMSWVKEAAGSYVLNGFELFSVLVFTFEYSANVWSVLGTTSGRFISSFAILHVISVARYDLAMSSVTMGDVTFNALMRLRDEFELARGLEERRNYVCSFFGIVDLVTVAPFWIQNKYGTKDNPAMDGAFKDPACQDLRRRLEKAEQEARLARERELRSIDQITRWDSKRLHCEEASEGVELLRLSLDNVKAELKRLEHEAEPGRSWLHSLRERQMASQENARLSASRLTTLKAQYPQRVAEMKASQVQEIADLRSSQAEELLKLEVDWTTQDDFFDLLPIEYPFQAPEVGIDPVAGRLLRACGSLQNLTALAIAASQLHSFNVKPDGSYDLTLPQFDLELNSAEVSELLGTCRQLFDSYAQLAALDFEVQLRCSGESLNCAAHSMAVLRKPSDLCQTACHDHHYGDYAMNLLTISDVAERSAARMCSVVVGFCQSLQESQAGVTGFAGFARQAAAEIRIFLDHAFHVLSFLPIGLRALQPFSDLLEHGSPAFRHVPVAGLRWDVLLHILGSFGAAERSRGLRVAEIGVEKGMTVTFLMKHEPAIVDYYLVDPWHVPGKSQESNGVLQSYYENLEAWSSEEPAFQRNGRKAAHVLRQSSEEAAGQLGTDYFDLVFIDAEHTFEAVRRDIQVWKRRVRPGGILAGHDFSLFHPAVSLAVLVECGPLSDDTGRFPLQSELEKPIIHLSADSVATAMICCVIGLGKVGGVSDMKSNHSEDVRSLKQSLEETTRRSQRMTRDRDDAREQAVARQREVHDFHIALANSHRQPPAVQRQWGLGDMVR